MATVKQEVMKAAEIVRDAGGQIVGRTKLQKVAYLLELTDQGSGFEFEYRHYGPYSEALTDAIRVADAFGLVTEEERTATWGGRYSIYKVNEELVGPCDSRAKFATAAAAISAVELELAATAAYLHVVENCPDAWKETERRKPEKAADGRLEKAKRAYRDLLELKTPKPLPNI